MRLAVFVAALAMLVWVFDEQHVASIWELYLFLMAAGWALFEAALLALFYLALEPCRAADVANDDRFVEPRAGGQDSRSAGWRAPAWRPAE